jgi:uncharacterized Fe-S cluster protein YjdI
VKQLTQMLEKKEYTNGDITVIWRPNTCIHSALCFKELSNVFDPRRRPWIDLSQAETAQIIEQVKKCPSGALSYHMNDAANPEAQTQVETVVEVLRNGPLLVYGTLKVKDKDGNEALKSQTTAFCRCGASKTKPYCDGSHSKIGFED